ncbi:nickel ABC transporter ATP-binding protein NikE [Chelatococcus reniformis]|uniref:ABC transporter ATP-binding protein n=1 Tax=Chelatococcus reniformis TaxID=1494448 RepID=A0A916XIZ9_9HYPH|nr:ABC transporter ATP-binding protein [Chelatococcus reniformis]GGC75525.1 ABC transporter ATP-binding protein [Chelatococcus reniformis]
MTAGTPLVDIEGLSVRFGADGPAVVHDVDLVVHPGECVALVGESGSGKSVTARSLINLAGPGARTTSRRLLIGGEDASRFDAARWRRLRGTFAGLVMQDALTSLDPLRTIGQEVAEVVVHHRLPVGRRRIGELVADTLARVGVPEPEVRARQYAHQLSGGLRQRALIASAIAGQPRLIIADEPTTALDATVQAQVIAVLKDRVREGAGLLLISHDLAVVAGIADRVHVMRAGRVVDAGPTAEVLARPRHPYTRQLIAAVPSPQARGSRLASARIAPDDAGGPIRILREPLPARPAVSDEVVLEARGLTKTYRHRGGRNATFTALEDVSFSIRAGEVVGLVGESGSGKSTCAKIVLGLLEPDRGSVRLLGEPWSGLSERARRPRRAKLQYIPQDALSSFDPRYRVKDIVGENLPGLDAAAGARRIGTLLEQVGLAPALAERHPRSLSGGQRQRVAIARALAAEPALVVCDEPVSALDVSIQAQVVDLIAELQAKLGTALLFISHDLGLVRHMADRLIVLKDGRIVEAGDAIGVFDAPAHTYTRSLIASLPAPLLAGPASPHPIGTRL